jgi:hypothetical protein
MPASVRPRYERVLTEGAAGQLEAAMKIWARADAPNAAAFHATYFDDIASLDTAARLWAIAVTMGMTRTPAATRGAAGDFGAVMQTIGVDVLPRIATALAARAQAALLAQNTRQLADLINTGARGEGVKAQQAVGATVLNRMQRNRTIFVEDVRSGYRYGVLAPKGEAIWQIAQGLLTGTVGDPTGGATHMYSPDGMPKKGEPLGKSDVSGGLEAVPGVVAKNRIPAENYRPGFAADKKFHEVRVEGVAQKFFKFYRVDGNGAVR